MKMADVRTWRERAQAKRRGAAVGRAVEYLNVALEMLPGARKGSAERQVRESSQPMTTAKALVKDWRRRNCSLAAKPTPRDERDALVQAAFAMELGHVWPFAAVTRVNGAVRGSGAEQTSERGNHV